MHSIKFLFLLIVIASTYDSSNGLTITIDSSAAPNLRNFLERSASTIRQYWDNTAKYLASPGFSPRTSIKLVAKKNLGAPAAAGGDTIWYDVDYGQQNQNDMGMSVHEATHIIQSYRSCPGWLTEGIADYIRYFRFNVAGDQNRKPRKPANTNKGWERGYGDTAYFLDWTQKQKNQNLVPALNRLCREGRYKDEAWRELTRQTIEQNWNEMQRNARFRYNYVGGLVHKECGRIAIPM